jgi:hypothetical protein
MICDAHHDTQAEVGHCPDHAALYREGIDGITRLTGDPYWWLSFVDRIQDEDGDVAFHQGVAIVPGPDVSTAIDTAWLTGCNPGSEVMGYQLDRGDVERAGVPTFTLLDGADLAAAQGALRAAHKETSP